MSMTPEGVDGYAGPGNSGSGGSGTLDPASYYWIAPALYPNDGALYIWDESILNWKLYSINTV